MRNIPSDHHVKVRIGIHCGSVIAGVIGQSKFAYDLWGDTVNVANRMESTGEAGKIQISQYFADHIKNDFNVIQLGSIDVKGKGQLTTYFIDKKGL